MTNKLPCQVQGSLCIEAPIIKKTLYQRTLRCKKTVLILSICLTAFGFARGQFTQQGPKLVGNGAIGYSNQGESVSLSADGNTAVVGGGNDDATKGAVWVYTRVGSNWVQQGNKLVCTGMIHGMSTNYNGGRVDISDDGNTIVVGGPGDNNNLGAICIFTRVNGVWNQQGPKLVGTGAVGLFWPYARQGQSVSISGDGNTVVVGGPGDDNAIGAVWVFTRFNAVWKQHGPKLVSPAADEREHSTRALFGQSVSISSDGNTILIGADDPSGVGGAWVFDRSGWLGGPKLSGSGGVPDQSGKILQGWSVAISGDGNTAIVGGTLDNNNIGASWVFIKAAGVWMQQGSKLVGSGWEGSFVNQGHSLDLSFDGNRAVIGGQRDNKALGAVWVFDRFNNAWAQSGAKLTGSGSTREDQIYQGCASAISDDGKTIIFGGKYDGVVGAAWVYTFGVSIDSFNPLKSAVLDTITIKGIGFVGITSVNFGNTPADWFRVDSSNKIRATVGKLGSSGNVRVTTANSTATKSGFTIAEPVITNFTPSIAAAGATVTISGNNLTGASSVSFGGLPAVSFTIISKTTITATLGEGTSGAVSVTTPGGTATKTGFYAIPTITAFTPAIAGAGETVYITGTNFIEVSSVSFGGIPAASFFINSRNNLTAVLGKGSSGSITVATPGGTAVRSGFIVKPTITGFTPVAAGVNNTVTIYGTNFIGATAVSFGGIAANGFSVLGDSIITALVGPGAPGDVAVTTPGGTATATGFAYAVVLFPTPVVNSFSPVSGTKGTLLTIAGNNFDSVKAVSIGGVTATSFAINNNTSITAVVGKTISGNVSVTSKGGTGSKAGFTYITAAPTIISISPAEAESGTSITIKGTNLNGASTVSFGGTSVSSFTVANDSTIIAKPGTGSSGSVAVTTPGGSTSGGNFILLAPTAVTSFSPTSASTGTTVTILGTNFTGATSVKFGGTPAASFAVINSTTINAVVALGSSGLVSVTTPSRIGGLGGFTHVVSTPEITAFSPVSAGPGASITITGSNFSGIYDVKLGGVAVSSFNIVNNTTITAIVGAVSSGSVSVTNEAGTGSKTGFTFIAPNPPVITSFSPDFAAAGAEIIIRGNNLSSTFAVSFGGVPARSFQILNDTSAYVSAILGSGTSGNVTVTTPGGNSSKTGFYYYSTIPSITTFSPANGPTGTTVTIRGTNLNDVTGVSFGGVPASSFSLLADSAWYIKAIVGNGASGNITVTKSSGSGVSAGVFTIASAGNTDTIALCPNGTLNLISNISGASYQWQIFTDSGYTNLTNTTVFSGATTNILQLNNIPSYYSGSQFRCVVNGNMISKVTTLKFSMIWTGNLNTDWENTANWGCGSQLPDENTDVIITNGTIVLNNSVSIKSIRLSTGVNLTILAGVELNVKEF